MFPLLTATRCHLQRGNQTTNDDIGHRSRICSASIVFASSVQSGFLPPKRATVDRNRSRTDPDIEGTEPNHLGPVYFGLWSRFRPIQTGFFAYNLLYQYKPFVS
ncbi:uncharacterized protein LACBIDRAFT_318615 [Laccaria bicolor S238N-H82]|uniref:Predicted protein n=1 Tax=Laccaria bicolor (strain S238N-H82 / ATCC MYA-4686) TaxID=486041 RepID=B0E2S0_LACBS|nr:uncharacterized protein LACBIDRAFT_318615 [Laccaria bicolor S238N-H82]EDQ98853.1 predicted protein [Laccaria bicolor S238N-H82]|eukprot:XP_001890488.1 predicted protein [Laccaria bicolor S238N-H82]